MAAMSTESNNSINETKSSSSLLSSKYAYYWSSSNDDGPSTFQTIIGSIALLTFILIWLASLVSPIYGLYWFWKGEAYIIPLFILILLTLIAYLPWENSGPLSHTIKSFARYSTFFYKKCIIIFQNQQSLPEEAATRTEEEKQKGNDKGGQQQQRRRQPLLYAIHPHGAFCLGWSLLFCSTMMEDKVRFCFSPLLYASPLFRLWSRLTGHPGSASKNSMINYMKEKKKNSIRHGDRDHRDHLALPPGGFEEATLTCRNKDRVYIKRRTGFVKLALQHGYNVVPVYCFGENQTYDNIQGMWNFRLWLNKLGMPAIVVFGSWFFPLLPRRDDPRGIRVVVGEPVVLPKINNPSRDEVRHWHEKYIAALIRIFEEHKEDYYGHEIAKTQKLEIW